MAMRLSINKILYNGSDEVFKLFWNRVQGSVKMSKILSKMLYEP